MWKKEIKPGMEGVLNNFLAVLSPFVTIVKNIHIAHGFEAESWLSHFLPPLYPLHLRRRRHPQPRRLTVLVATAVSAPISPPHKPLPHIPVIQNNQIYHNLPTSLIIIVVLIKIFRFKL